jgi:hypothetical protein
MELGGLSQIDDEDNVLSCVALLIFIWLVKTHMRQTGEKVWQYQ